MMNKYLFTCGDVNGIGPEIVIKTLNKIAGTKNFQFYFVCPSNVFKQTCKIVKPKFDFKVSKSFNPSDQDKVIILKINDVKVSPGKPTAASGKTAYNAIKLGL